MTCKIPTFVLKFYCRYIEIVVSAVYSFCSNLVLIVVVTNRLLLRLVDRLVLHLILSVLCPEIAATHMNSYIAPRAVAIEPRDDTASVPISGDSGSAVSNPASTGPAFDSDCF